MSTTFPSGDVWGSADFVAAYTKVTYPLSVCVLILNFSGVVAFYSFRKQRKFPASVLAWIGILNCCYSSFLIAKWAPGTASRSALVVDATEGVCVFSLWADSFNFYALVSLNTLVGLTLYLSICKRQDLDYASNPKFFWGYVAFFWVICIVAPLVISYAPGTGFRAGVCQANSSTIYGEFAPEFLMVIFQLFFVISSITHAGKIITAAKSTSRTKKDVRLLYMMVRFSATIFSELLVLVPYYVLNYYGETIPVAKVASVCIPLGGLCDGCILLFGNRALMRLSLKKFRSLSPSDDSSAESSGSGARVSVSMSSRVSPGSSGGFRLENNSSV